MVIPLLYFWYLNLRVIANHIRELIPPKGVKVQSNWMSLGRHSKSDYGPKRRTCFNTLEALVSPLNMLSNVYSNVSKNSNYQILCLHMRERLVNGSREVDVLQCAWVRSGAKGAFCKPDILQILKMSSKEIMFCSFGWDLWPHRLMLLCDHGVFLGGTIWNRRQSKTYMGVGLKRIPWGNR